jgi:hypothetical protein
MQRTRTRNNQDHNSRTIFNEILAEVVEPRFVMPFLAKGPIERFVKHITTQNQNTYIGFLIYSSE